MSKMGLFINYEYCTGCHACEVACKKHLNLEKGQFGMHVLQDGPRLLPDGKKWEYTYLPYPSHLCDMCADRTKEGRLPTCAHHCQGGVIEYGPLEELVKLAAEQPHSVIYALQ
ncbi:4Fe-4S dicluster domain-containing protein [Adlercreutzia sp. ZJ473]|uniref:4Fe-4S dicluster domain-containing protein n=1 Tax=Adlercreutzia sp. ZJ473 TaxID=2722822 RepID=UPI0015564925|nr:4Fe-4S dicluster domain-containing protein [Adlercreutzia sp. ZJ473]